MDEENCDTCGHWEEWHDTIDTKELPVYPENPCLNCWQVTYKNYKPFGERKMKNKCGNCGKEHDYTPEAGDVVVFCSQKCKKEWFDKLPNR